MAEPTVQVYDQASGRVITIPVRELSDEMVAATVKGIEGAVYISRAQLRPGPAQHHNLSAELRDRIRRVIAVFAEVWPAREDKWIEDFCRDTEPEPEIRIWEKIAATYSRLTRPSDSLCRRRETAMILLSCANNNPTIARLTVRCTTLTNEEIASICEAWES